MSTVQSLSEFSQKLRVFIRETTRSESTNRTQNTVVCDFETLAFELFQLQSVHNPTYKAWLKAKNVSPENVMDPDSIPHLPISAFRSETCTCIIVSDRCGVFESSGTTSRESRSKHFHCLESLEVYEASVLPWFQAHFLPDFEGWRGRLFSGPLEPPDFLFLTPPPALCPRSSLVTMFGMIQKEFAPTSSIFVGTINSDGSWGLDASKINRSFSQANDFSRPIQILGTALNYVALLKLLEGCNERYTLPEGSRLLETGGYKGRSIELSKPDLYTQLTRSLDIPDDCIVSEYGMCELSSQAYDLVVNVRERGFDEPMPPEFPKLRNFNGERTSVSRLFQFPPWVRWKIVSPETGMEVLEGEPGILRIFDMANVFSVAAIETEDLAVRRGNGFTLLGRSLLSSSKGCSLNAAVQPN